MKKLINAYKFIRHIMFPGYTVKNGRGQKLYLVDPLDDVFAAEQGVLEEGVLMYHIVHGPQAPVFTRFSGIDYAQDAIKRSRRYANEKGYDWEIDRWTIEIAD